MPAGDEPTGEEALVRQVLEARAQAIRAKNTDGVLSHYAEDLTVFELAPPLSIGAKEALDRRSQEQWFRAWRGPIGWETRNLRIAVAGDVAFSYALNRLTGTSAQGERTDMWVRQDDRVPQDRRYLEDRPRAYVGAVLYGRDRRRGGGPAALNAYCDRVVSTLTVPIPFFPVVSVMTVVSLVMIVVSSVCLEVTAESGAAPTCSFSPARLHPATQVRISAPATMNRIRSSSS